MGIGKQARLRRIFRHPTGRLCSVAVDHFLGYDGGPSQGLGDLRRALEAIVAGGPDAVTMFKGTALGCWLPFAGTIPLIVQSGCFTPDDRVIERLATPEEVLRLGADAMAVAIGVRGPHEGRYLRLLSDAVEAAAAWDLPVIAHIYPRRYEGGARIVCDADEIFWAARCGIECGADIIKIAYTGDVPSFRQIVSTCPVPVVAAGGPRASSRREALAMMAAAVEAGARGATIGRNVWGTADPAAAVRAFRAVIQDGANPAQALAAHGGE